MANLLVNNPNTKITYKDATENVMTLFPGPIPALQKYGAWNPATESLGGESYTFNILSSFGASTGFPSSTNSLTHLGAANPNNSKVAITTSFVWSRASQDYTRKVARKVSGQRGSFFDEAQVKLMGCIKGFAADMNLLMAKTGNGDFTNIATSGGSALSANQTVTSTPASIVVSRLEFIRPDMVLDVYSGSSQVPNIQLYVISKTRGVGQGSISVVNLGSSSSYTPTAGDTLVLSGARSQGLLYLSGALDWVNAAPGAYPRVEGNNVQPTNYTDYVAMSQAVNAEITLAALWQGHLLVKAQRANQNIESVIDPTGYIESASEVVWLHPYHITSLRNALAPNIRYANNELPSGNSVWGPLTMVNGLPCYVAWTNPTDQVLYIDAKGVQFAIPSAEIRTTQGMPWVAIPGTSQDEIATCTAIVSVCTDLKSQGTLTGCTGKSATDFNF